MKKLLALLLSLCLVAALCAGCGSTPTPADDDSTTTTPEEPVTVRLGGLKGPTSMGMVKLLSDNDAGKTTNHYEFSMAGSADELTPKMLQGELDIVSVPANLASVLYNKTEGGVQALAVNVLGVLYVAEFNGETVQSVADLKGKTLYATGKGSTPEYFLRYVLTQNGLDPDKDLTIEWKSEPSEVVATLNDQGAGIAMLPQPYVTAAAAQLGEGFRVALSVSDEWEKVGNSSLCTTACILVRKGFAEENPQAVEKFLADFAESAAWVNENVDDAAAACGQYEIVKEPIAKKAIPQCNIVCITGSEMKDALGGCLNVLFEQNPAAVGGALPDDAFYYGA